MGLEKAACDDEKTINGLQLSMNGFTVFYTGHFTASGFLTAYLGSTVCLAIYFACRSCRRGDPWMKRPEHVYLMTSVAEVEAQAKAWDDEKGEKSIRQPKWLNKFTAILWR